MATVQSTAIARRVREREVARQLRQNRSRKRAVELRIALRATAARRVPALAREYLETLLGSLLGLTVVFELLAHLARVSPLYSLPACGLVYASQSTYYTIKLAADPDFAIPTCRCAGRRREGTADVLRSPRSALLGVPNSALALVFFAALLASTGLGRSGVQLPLTGAAVAASAYLGYVMLVRVRSVCSICVNIAAINLLLLWQLV